MRGIRVLCATFLVLGYLLSPLAVVFAATVAPQPTCQLGFQTSSGTTGATSVNSSITINVGGSVTLVWQSTNATGGNITSVGPVGPSGAINLLPSSASQTTFIGTFTGAGGTILCSARVYVNSVSSGSGGTSGQTTGQTVVSTPTATPAAPLQSSNGGLVPCGTGTFNGNGSDQNSSTGCQACNLVQLVQNIITFCIGLSIPIVAALFAYAGVLYFTSGANPGNIDKARRVFKNAFLGFCIVISGYLVINTLLHALLDGGQVFYSGGWFTIQCDLGTRNVNANLNQVLGSMPAPTLTTTSGPAGPYGGVAGPISSAGDNSGNGIVVGGVDTITGAYDANPGAGPGGTCGSGYNYIQSDINNVSTASCQNAQGQTSSLTPYSTSNPNTYATAIISAGGWSTNSSASALTGTQQYTGTLQSLCANTNSPDPNCSQNTQIIMAIECGGKNCPVNTSGAVGLMQAYPPTACGLDSTIPGCSTCSSQAPTSGGCTQVASALYQDPNLNLRIGVQEWNSCYNAAASATACVAAVGQEQCAAACYNGGPGAMAASNQCANMAKFQCGNPATASPSSWVGQTLPYVGRFTLTKSLLQ